jgi:cell division protein FtsB
MADLDFQTVVARTAEYVDQQNRRVAELEKQNAELRREVNYWKTKANPPRDFLGDAIKSTGL